MSLPVSVQGFLETGINIKHFATKADFPANGDPNVLYIADDTDSVYYWWDGSYIFIAGNANQVLKYFEENRNEISSTEAYSELTAVNDNGESYNDIAFHFHSLGDGGYYFTPSVQYIANTGSSKAFVVNQIDQSNANISVTLRNIVFNEERGQAGTSSFGIRGIALNCSDTNMSQGNRCTAINSPFPFAGADTNKFFTAGAYAPGARGGGWRTWAMGYNPTTRGSSQLAIGIGNLNGGSTFNGTAQFIFSGGKVQTTDATPTTLVIDQEAGESAPTNFKTASNGYYHFNCDFVVKNITDSEISTFNVRFSIKNDGGNASLAGNLLFNQIEMGAGIDANSVSVSITNSDEVQVNVTGVSGKTINWMASYRITEVNG